MIKGLPRSKAGLGSSGCAGCSASLVGPASARTFSTRTNITTTTRTPSYTPSSPHTATNSLSHPHKPTPTSTQPFSRSFGSTAARATEPASAETEDELAERLAQQELDEMVELMNQFEEQQLAHQELSPAPIAYATPTRSPSHSPQPSSSLAQDPIPEPTPSINPFALLRPSFPAGPPTISDLNSLRPKMFARPDASSPESLRILYAKSWTAGLNNLNTAFKKSQLIKMATLPTEQGGLELKHDDGRLKTGIKINKRTKYWKPKKFEMMSKRELSQAIMVLEWGLVDPDTLPKAKVGPSVVESELRNQFNQPGSGCRRADLRHSIRSDAAVRPITFLAVVAS